MGFYFLLGLLVILGLIGLGVLFVIREKESDSKVFTLQILAVIGFVLALFNTLPIYVFWIGWEGSRVLDYPLFYAVTAFAIGYPILLFRNIRSKVKIVSVVLHVVMVGVYLYYIGRIIFVNFNIWHDLGLLIVSIPILTGSVLAINYKRFKTTRQISTF